MIYIYQASFLNSFHRVHGMFSLAWLLGHSEVDTGFALAAHTSLEAAELYSIKSHTAWVQVMAALFTTM